MRQLSQNTMPKSSFLKEVTPKQSAPPLSVFCRKRTSCLREKKPQNTQICHSILINWGHEIAHKKHGM